MYSAKIEGLEAMVRRLESLPADFRRKAATAALRAAANVAAKEARTTTAFRDRTGLLRSSIRVRASRGRVRLVAGAAHAALIERGHGGPHPAPPHPFLEPAVRSTGPAQIKAMEASIARWLKRMETKR